MIEVITLYKKLVSGSIETFWVILCYLAIYYHFKGSCESWSHWCLSMISWGTGFPLKTKMKTMLKTLDLQDLDIQESRFQMVCQSSIFTMFILFCEVLNYIEREVDVKGECWCKRTDDNRRCPRWFCSKKRKWYLYKGIETWRSWTSCIIPSGLMKHTSLKKAAKNLLKLDEFLFKRNSRKKRFSTGPGTVLGSETTKILHTFALPKKNKEKNY